MAAIASISINDAVPAAHVFSPITTNPASYRKNDVTSVPVIGEESISLSLKAGNSTSESVNRVKIALRIPVLEVPEGGTPSGYVASPKVAYSLQANIDLILPNRSTAAQRTTLRTLLSNLLQNAQVVALVDKMEQPY